MLRFLECWTHCSLRSMDALETCALKAKTLRAEKKRLAKDFRNAEKRRRRLRARCKELPAEDLLEVLAMRRVRDAAAGPTTEEEEPPKG